MRHSVVGLLPWRLVGDGEGHTIHLIGAAIPGEWQEDCSRFYELLQALHKYLLAKWFLTRRGVAFGGFILVTTDCAALRG